MLATVSKLTTWVTGKQGSTVSLFFGPYFAKGLQWSLDNMPNQKDANGKGSLIGACVCYLP